MGSTHDHERERNARDWLRACEVRETAFLRLPDLQDLSADIEARMEQALIDREVAASQLELACEDFHEILDETRRNRLEADADRCASEADRDNAEEHRRSAATDRRAAARDRLAATAELEQRMVRQNQADYQDVAD